MAPFRVTTPLSPRALAARGVPTAPIVHGDGAALATAVMLNVLGLALPLITLHIYDRVLPNQSLATLSFLALGLVVVAALELGLRAALSMVRAPSAAAYARDLKLAALARFLTPDSGADETVRTPTQLIERLGAVDRFAAYYGGAARSALIDLPFAALALGLVVAIGGVVALAPIAVMAIYLGVLGWYGVSLRRRSRERQDNDTKISDFLLETFSSILTVKSLGLERTMLRRYERLLATAAANQEQIALAAGSVQRLSMLFGNITVVATLGAGAGLAIAGEMTLGAVAASTLLASRAVQPAVRAAKAWTEIQRAALAAEDVGRLFEGRSEAMVAEVATASAPPTLRIGGEGGAAAAGSIILLDGGDAWRRNAVLATLAGLHATEPADPNPNDAPMLDGLPPTRWRRAHGDDVVLTPPGGARFRGTILENLTLFGRGATVQAAFEAAAAIGLDNELRKLPAGYDTPIAMSVGETLSPSMFKSIALARALAQAPALLLLDRPEVQLDAQTLARLFATLEARRGRSTVLISSADAGARAIADHTLILGSGSEAPLRLERIDIGPATAPEIRAARS